MKNTVFLTLKNGRKNRYSFKFHIYTKITMTYKKGLLPISFPIFS